MDVLYLALLELSVELRDCRERFERDFKEMIEKDNANMDKESE